MTWRLVPAYDFKINIFDLWDNHWFLLTAGDFRSHNFNTMTVAWGSFGIMWNKPFVQVVVRPTRYTFMFMEKYESFTLCAFDHRYRKAMQLLGAKSGRDGDKIAESGLTPKPSSSIAAPAFEEAEIVLECKKIYSQDFDPTRFLDPDIEKSYPRKDYHRVYFGEILTISERQK